VVGEVIEGRYELEELVGSGGMSSVYRARDRLLERRVALKILHEYYTADEEYVERFRREARAAARLSHPNIVTVIDRGADEGRHYIVFEYIDGQTLKEYADDEGPLAVRRALELAIQIAHGLAFAHDNGLIHRDVKPQNVILNGDGQPKVTDFGIARSVDVEGVTKSGTVLGTSNYISPEQASGKTVDGKTDVYALGVVLFELLTGRVPFPGESFVAVALQHVHEPPPDVLELRPDLPPRVAAAIGRALEKDPADRFDSMADFASELEACLARIDAGTEAEQTLVRPRPAVPRRERGRRPGWLLPALLLAAAVAVIAGVLLATRDSGDGGAGAAATPGQAVRLKGTAVWDPPPGDAEEHAEDAPDATDGDPATFWRTETYRTFSKAGVGVVLEAPESVELATLTVRTDTPGITAVIRAGDSKTGPWTTVSSPRGLGPKTTFRISGGRSRYFLVWITNLDDHAVAHVNEVAAAARRS
jgi:serine/threonine-protein kinase